MPILDTKIYNSMVGRRFENLSCFSIFFLLTVIDEH